MSKFRWIVPGLKIKRWLLLICAGIVFIFLGASGVTFWALSGEPAKHFFAIVSPLFLLIGFFLTFFGIQGMTRSVVTILGGDGNQKVLERAVAQSALRQGPKIVVFGGGTGLNRLLSGLKKYTSNITAIVTVADNGGHSGWLRKDLGILPPGDIRNCLVALSDVEPLMEKLMQYRFNSIDLEGYNFGNLFLAAVTKVTGDFCTAVGKMGQILSIRGKVLPSTSKLVSLVACFEDGTRSTGEAEIAEENSLRGKKITDLRMQPDPGRISGEIEQVIEEAELIILGPGSLYTSVLPNLIIEGMMDALLKASAEKIYVCNAMTQPGETGDFSACDHIQGLYDIVKQKGWVDYVVVNDRVYSDDLLVKYERCNSFPVSADHKRLHKLGLKVVHGDFVTEEDYARHDPEKLARAILELCPE